MRLTVIVPTAGKRPSLSATMWSAASQMHPGDELLVDVNSFPWGGEARNRKITQATGSAILFQDDDDIYAPGALDAVRHELELEPLRPHVFRMLYVENQFTLWEDPVLRCGNVASQMFCVPNIPRKIGRWSDRRESDYDFISSTAALMGEPVWHERVISLVRHPQLGATDG